MLADRIVVPEDERHFFDEQVVYLPDTYWVNDLKRAIAEHIPTRAECGLPDAAFVVFCNFNNSYKLDTRHLRAMAAHPQASAWKRAVAVAVQQPIASRTKAFLECAALRETGGSPGLGTL